MKDFRTTGKKEDNHAPGRPFLKWAGGKGQLLETFLDYYPHELKAGLIENYYEPFLGGGAVFFHIIQTYKIGTAYLYDRNKDLVLTYLVVRDEVPGLMQALSEMEQAYHNLDEQGQKVYYYAVRDDLNSGKDTVNYRRFSKKWVERAAQLLFLNRTCFNGLFRFNSKGEFNVPRGRYKRPRILDERNLEKVSRLLSGVSIKNADFRVVGEEVKGRSFVYYDPPYRPINQTSHFTAYSRERFDDGEQKALGRLFTSLDKKDVLQMLSNSDPKNHDPRDEFFDELYHDFHLSRVPARRLINSKGEKRSAISEIIVTNYKPGSG